MVVAAAFAVVVIFVFSHFAMAGTGASWDDYCGDSAYDNPDWAYHCSVYSTGDVDICTIVSASAYPKCAATAAPTTAATSTTGTSGSSDVSFYLPSPLKSTSLRCFLFDAVDGVLKILAVVAALYILWCGFLFVAAQGNEEKLKQAKRSFLYAVIGTAVLLGAWGIISFVINTIDGVTSTNIPGVPSSSSCS